MRGEAPLTIEFKEDGSYVAISAQGLLFGRWEVIDGNQLATWRTESRPKRISRFKVLDDSLIITDANGVAHNHTRVHPTRP